MSIPALDEQLWFHHHGCSGKHFVLGNPHTFPGRMLGFCSIKQRSFFFSKGEVEESSPETAAWIDGFLAASEPKPPRDENGDLLVGPHYDAWVEAAAAFRRTGGAPSK